jgi:hypothetical protein
VKVHRPVVVLHPALLDGQSVLLAHPHWPPPVTGSHTAPDVPPLKPAVHEAQMPPLLPHAVVPVPGCQVPPVAAEQQPPLQGCDVPQLVVHVCVVTSHAWSVGQSAAVWQPHAFAGVPVRHTLPAALPVHTVHVALPVSHADGSVPATHLPVDAQQPPLHAVSAVLPHAVEHTPFAVSHAMPVGQSVALVQPGASCCTSAGASGPASGTGASVVASGWCAGASTAASSGNCAPSNEVPESGNSASPVPGFALEKLQAARPAHKSAITKGTRPLHAHPMASL